MGLVRLRIREYAQQRGWTLKEVSERSGVVYSTLRTYARSPGLATVDVTALQKLARTFDVMMEDLMKWWKSRRGMRVYLVCINSQCEHLAHVYLSLLTYISAYSRISQLTHVYLSLLTYISAYSRISQLTDVYLSSEQDGSHYPIFLLALGCTHIR